MKIAIASGKGGTGKTTLSVNLASYLSNNNNVVLVDLDVEEPNSALFIKGDNIHNEIKYKPVPKWDKDKCTLCGKCKEVCPVMAIDDKNGSFKISDFCIKCGKCIEQCPENCIRFTVLGKSTVNQYLSVRDLFIFTALLTSALVGLAIMP